MRALHLYTSLFLVPWMLVYAASAFCLNHGAWIVETLGIKKADWQEVRQVDFTPDAAFPQSPEEQAEAILRHLDLDGAHLPPRSPTPNQMIIFRFSGSGNYRITWQRQRAKLIVEQQQPFSFYRLLHFLHFRGGYAQPYFAFVAWAVLVDAVALSIVIWVVSGIYIWARRPRKRLLGGICVVAGSLLFMGLTVLLCR
jgi:hypothetical protein